MPRTFSAILINSFACTLIVSNYLGKESIAYLTTKFIFRIYVYSQVLWDYNIQFVVGLIDIMSLVDSGRISDARKTYG
jgi:hypothetical protein